MRFTRQSVEALTLPDGKPAGFFWDDALKGFGVKVNAGGSRQWVAQFRLPSGASKRMTIGRVDTLSIEDARKQARVILGKAQSGSDPHAEKAARKSQATITLKSIIDRYLPEAEKRLKPSTYYQAQHHLNNHAKSLHDQSAAQIRRLDIYDLCVTVRDGSGATAAQHTRAYLSALFSWAVGAGLIENNPVSGSNKPAETKSRTRVLTEAEIRAVWQASGDAAYGRIIRLLILTGQRRTETGSMVWSEVDRENALWTIPGERTKNGLLHEVPLSRPALDILADHPRIEGRDLIFGQGIGGFAGWSKSKERLDARIKAADVKMSDWTIHDLRRTAATMMADKLGILPHVIEAVLNHVSGHRAGVAGIYNRASYKSEKRDALDQWADYVMKLQGLA